jgi:hypothetical protein
MHPDDHAHDSPAEGQEPAPPPPVVMTTTDPVIASGGRGEGQRLRPDQTIAADTAQGVPIVEPKRPEPGKKGQDHPDDRKKVAAHLQQRPAWAGLAMTAVVASACGLGGAWAFTHFGSSKDKDQSQGGDQASGGDSSKKGGSSTGQGQPAGKQAAGDPDAASPNSMANEDPQLSKDQIQQLYARFAVLQQRVDAMSTPVDTNPSDLASIHVKLGELSDKVEGVASLPERIRRMEDRLDGVQGEMKGLRDQLTTKAGRVVAPSRPVAAPDRKVELIAAPAPAPSPPTDAGSPDETLASGIDLFKKGLYTKADEVFGKLRASKSKDARAWYFSALAHGFATGQWEGETRTFVVQGADREREGSPPASQIDSAVAGLSPAQGKDWLASYRAQLAKR